MSSPPTDPSLPDWALSRANAALKVGQTMPEIEKGLVAKGLPPALATAVVTAVVESRVRASRPPGPSDASIMAHRIASVVAAVICSGLAYAYGGGYSAGWTALSLIILVTCIWFADAIAEIKDVRRFSLVANLCGRGRIEWDPPPGLLRLVAWVVVVLIGVYHVVLLIA